MPSYSHTSAQKRRKRHLTRSVLRRRIKEVALQFRQRWLETYPTILVSLFLILSVWLLFGVEYIIIPPVLILVFRQRHTQEFSLRVLLRTYFILLLVCLAAFLATRNLLLCAVLNLAVPFLVVGLLSDKFNPKSYFVYGMEFVFFQMTPVSLPHLGMQLVVMVSIAESTSAQTQKFYQLTSSLLSDQLRVKRIISRREYEHFMKLLLE